MSYFSHFSDSHLNMYQHLIKQFPLTFEFEINAIIPNPVFLWLESLQSNTQSSSIRHSCVYVQEVITNWMFFMLPMLSEMLLTGSYCSLGRLLSVLSRLHRQQFCVMRGLVEKIKCKVMYLSCSFCLNTGSSCLFPLIIKIINAIIKMQWIIKRWKKSKVWLFIWLD